MIARPALAAVTEALGGVTDPREAVEILVARDLWPMEGAPRIFCLDFGEASPGDGVREVAAVASCGVAALRTAEVLLREASEFAPYGGGAHAVLWTAQQVTALGRGPMMGPVRRAVEALRGGRGDTDPAMPRGPDRRYLGPLRQAFGTGFDIATVDRGKAIVIAPPPPDLSNLQPSPVQTWVA